MLFGCWEFATSASWIIQNRARTVRATTGPLTRAPVLARGSRAHAHRGPSVSTLVSNPGVTQEHLPSLNWGRISPKWLFLVTLGDLGCRIWWTENPRVGGSIPPLATTNLFIFPPLAIGLCREMGQRHYRQQQPGGVNVFLVHERLRSPVHPPRRVEHNSETQTAGRSTAVTGSA